MKRMLVLLLALALCAGLLPGCGVESAVPASVTEADAASSAEEPSAESVQATPQNEVAESAEEENAGEPAASAEEPAASAEELPVISYPLTDDTITLTIMSNCFPDVASMLDGQLGNTYACRRALEVTGVALDSTLFLDTTAFLMAVTSGDYPDLFGNNLVNFYTGGRTAMYADGVIIDLSDMLRDCAPDYYRYFSEDENFAKQLTLDSGEVVSMSVYNKPINQGAVIRQDLLDELNLEIPETYGELENVLRAFVDSGRVQTGLYTYGLLSTDHYSGFYNGFDLAMTGAFMDVDYQVDEDNRVAMSIMTPQYREFIEMMARWYTDGLIPQDFYTLNEGNTNGVLLNATVGFSYSGVDYMDPAFFNGSAAEGSQWVPIPDIRRTTDQTLRYGPIMQNVTSMCQLMISSACEYPEIALSYMNWFFTEEGSMAFNLGEEGVSYVDNGDGTYTYTDLVLHNPEGLAVRQARWLHAGIDVMPFLYVSEWQDGAAAVNDYQRSAADIWNQNKVTDGIYYGDLSVEETEEYSAMASDLLTYIYAEIPGFVMGDRPMSEWDSFQSALSDMGAERMVELKQEAYDRYLQR